MLTAMLTKDTLVAILMRNILVRLKLRVLTKLNIRVMCVVLLSVKRDHARGATP